MAHNDLGFFSDPTLLLEFIAESQEHLQTVDQKLLEYEQCPTDEELINTIFRAIHSIKGAAGFFNLKNISELSHKLEAILNDLRNRKREATPQVIDVLFGGTDVLKRLVERLSSDTDAQIDSLVGGEKNEYEQILGKLEGVLAGESAEPAPAKQPAREPEPAPAAEPAPALEATMPAAEAGSVVAASPKLVEEFKVEAAENLEASEQALVEFERDRGRCDLVNDIFRGIHTIKGTSDYLGFGAIRDFAHLYESLLDLLRRDESAEVADATFDLMFESTDYLKTACADPLGAPAAEVGLVERLRRQVAALGGEAVAQPAAIEKAPEQGAAAEAPEQPPAPDVAEAPETGVAEATVAEPSVLDVGSADPKSIAVFLTSAGQQMGAMQVCLQKIIAGDQSKKVVEAYLRAAASIKTAARFVGSAAIAEAAGKSEEILKIVLSGALGFEKEFLELLEEHLGTIVTELERIESGEAPRPAPEPEPAELEAAGPAVAEPIPAQPETPQPQPELAATEAQTMAEPVEQKGGQAAAEVGPRKVQAVKTMRIDQEKLDIFMNLVGELIITKNTFAHIVRRIEGNDFTDEMLKEFKSGVFSVNRISDDLQVNVMDMRMVPVRVVFSRFPRLVRDLARKNGKKVRLIVHGEETELDKGIAEDIGDPLVHLIRNSVDHGIETPERRREAGKDETGTIILRAAHEGNAIVIEITDDGAGIDPEKVKRKALEKGLITPDEADGMSERDLVKLICRPGFSTAEKVTDVSGRGVGMDVVHTNISKLNGTVKIESKVAEGTMIRVELPLTLAIIEALLVRAGGQDFAVPLDAVDETISIARDQIQWLQGKEAIMLRGEPIGLVHLDRLLRLKGNGGKSRAKLPVVILSVGVHRVGVVVEQLHDQEEIVIKPLDECLATIKGLGGASIMGDGRIVVILDPLEIVGMAVGGA